MNITLNDTRQTHTCFTRSWSASDWVRVLRNIAPAVIFASTWMFRLGMKDNRGHGGGDKDKPHSGKGYGCTYGGSGIPMAPGS